MTAPRVLWEGPAAELRSFKEAIGLRVELTESPNQIVFSSDNFRTDKLKLLPNSEATQLNELHAAFEGLINRYGPSLTLQLKFGADELSNQNYIQNALKTFCAAIEGYPISLYLKIDKQALAAHWNLTDPSADVKLFFSSDALAQALNQPLTRLEQANGLLHDLTGQKKLIILIPDHEIHLNGEYLAIIGGAAAKNWRNYLPSSKRDEAAAKIFAVHSEAVAKLKWEDITVRVLTPLQLFVSWEETNTIEPPPPGADPIARALYSQLLAFSLLHLATISKPSDSAAARAIPIAERGLLFTFAEDKYLARIELGSNESTGNVLIAGNQKDPWAASLTMAKLVEWVYKDERGIAIRLSLTQAVLGSSLQDSKPAEGLLDLVKRAPEIRQRILSRWDSFMDGKLQEYFANVKALEETVETTSKSYTDQVQSLTKTLTENMLAAVAVIVGSFLAAIFKAPFDRKIFVFGTSVYTVYLAIFPVFIGLIAAWQQYRKSQDSFVKRKRDFSSRLTEGEVNTIVGTAVSARETWFKRWFKATAAIYVAAILLMVLAICAVPHVVKQWADDFTLTNTSYTKPIDGRTVPLEIQGENFDKDKQIVVRIGETQFSNTGEPRVNVHGFTVLILAPTREDLQTAIDKYQGRVTVRQGGVGDQTVQLPQGRLPESPDPEVDRWYWTEKKNGGVLIATGSRFDSILKVTVNGLRYEFKTSDDRKQIEIYGLGKTAPAKATAILSLTDDREIIKAIDLTR
jgi:hypothetical protein